MDNNQTNQINQNQTNQTEQVNQTKKQTGNGILLGILAVATLVVTITGATFAYFTASVSGSAPVNAASYKFDMSLNVTKVNPATTPTKGDKLIPLASTDMAKAITAGCVDDNGYTSCIIYQLNFVNSGSASVTLSGNLKPTTNGFSNLKYATTAIGGAKSTLSGANALSGTTAVTTGFTNLTIPTGTSTMYLMLYINNTSSNQDGDMDKTFSGTLTFSDTSSGSNSQLKATFSA